VKLPTTEQNWYGESQRREQRGDGRDDFHPSGAVAQVPGAKGEEDDVRVGGTAVSLSNTRREGSRVLWHME